jgi:hypothetical protein
MDFVQFQDDYQGDFAGQSVEFKSSYYVNRILKYSKASPSSFIVALVYLERFQAEMPDASLTSKTLQRLFLVAVMTASKFLDDLSCGSQRW